jgi:hypothetical protein
MTEIELLAERLHLLALDGAHKRLKIATTSELEGFEPERDVVGNENCHRNCEMWFALHRQHKIVGGFLVMDEDGWIFNKHSVIDTGDSRLLDITARPPAESCQMLEFIEYWDSAARFSALPDRVNWIPNGPEVGDVAGIGCLDPELE